MPTNKQRRDAARRHLERQIQRRQEREATRRRFTLIASIVSTIAVVGAIVIVVVLATGGSSKHKTSAADNPTVSSPTATSPTPSATPSVSYPPATGKTVTFNGVTVKGATDLKGYPTVTSKASKNPADLEIKDLVVGTGKTATLTSQVTVQYVGVLYKNGLKFDASWTRGQPASFSMNGVIKGFQQGIAGNSHIAPMHVGGRRLIIIPSSLGYGAQASGAIPANSPLVFVVDLTAVG